MFAKINPSLSGQAYLMIQFVLIDPAHQIFLDSTKQISNETKSVVFPVFCNASIQEDCYEK